MADLEGVEQQSDVSTLISDYGEFWDPTWVTWKSKQLLGQKSKNHQSEHLNFFGRQGVYVLYKDYVPVYVGQSVGASIGTRLRAHHSSRRKGPRWNSFSWFGVETNDQRKVDTSELIQTLEALLIIVIDPRLNSKRESLKNARRWYQSEPTKQVSDEDCEPDAIAKRLGCVEEKLDQILKRLKQI